MNDNQYYEKFRNIGKIILIKRKEFVAMIPRIYKNNIYKKKGFASIYECAAKVGGISGAVVEEAIRVDEKLKELPKLRALMPEVGLSKLRRVADIANKKTEKQWVAKVQKMSKTALETHISDIKNSMPGHRKLIEPENPIYDKEFQDFTAKLDPDIILKLKIIKQKMGNGATWNDVFTKLVDLPLPKPQKNPKLSNSESRQASAKERRDALTVTNGKCSVPGCNRPAEEIHHSKPWSIFRKHDELEPLCRPHHELAHQSESIIDRKFRKYKMAKTSLSPPLFQV